jgi:hypothetical protein
MLLAFSVHGEFSFDSRQQGIHSAHRDSRIARMPLPSLFSPLMDKNMASWPVALPLKQTKKLSLEHQILWLL